MIKFYKLFPQSFCQIFDDTGRQRMDMIRVFPMSDFERNKELIEALNEQGAGVFFTPNPCEGGRKEENVTQIDWVYIDMDKGTKEEMKKKILNSPIHPDLVIESFRSYHCYWKVSCTKEQFNLIIQGLIQHFDADPAISSVNEVLRLPGFFHMKNPDRPFMIELRYSKIRGYSPDDMLNAFPYVPDQKTSVMTAKQPSEPYEITLIKQIPIKTVLESLGVEIKKNTIVENGELTSATINEKENYINRFSGKEGSGSTIDAVMYYGKKELPEAIKYLKQLGNITEADILLAEKPQEKDAIDMIDENPFTWGTELLDEKLSPIGKDYFIVVAGETGQGKTAWSFDMAFKNAQNGHKVLYLSLEMNTDAIYTRISREFARISKSQWRNKKLIKPDQVARYKRKKKELLDNKNLVAVGFSDGVVPNIENIKSIIKRVKPDLVFIDNFDLIVKDKDYSETSGETVAAMKLLSACKTTPIPIILLHHLRKGNTEGKKRGIDSLRGSGKIGHNADIIVMVYRPPFEEGVSKEELAKFTVIQLKDRDYGIGGFHICYFEDGTFKDKLASNLVDMALEAGFGK